MTGSSPTPAAIPPPPERRPDAAAPRDPRFQRAKRELHERLVAGINPVAAGHVPGDQLRQEVRRAAEELCRRSPELFTAAVRERLLTEVLDEAFGLGPLEPLLRDPTVTDVLVNGPKSVYVERAGRLEPAGVEFDDEPHLRQVVQRLVGRVGRHIDEGSPLVDARLADGSRVNAVFPPLALDGSLVSIRRFGTRPLGLDDLRANGALPAAVAEFLAGCVRGRLNVLVSGGTGSGKTTLLNALSAAIPDGERVVTIEDAAELRLQQRHVARMEARPANAEGAGAVTIRDLVRNALRMRPDRIVVGEVRGAEAVDMLQAMSTGHDGSLSTLHANDTRDALDRLEVMVGVSGRDLPLWTIRRQIASAVDVIAHVARLAGGVRRVVGVAEVTGLEGESVATRELFGFAPSGVGPDGRATGYFYATGAVPRTLGRLAGGGVRLPAGLFAPRVLPPEGGPGAAV